jgi:hypothetical protein
MGLLHREQSRATLVTLKAEYDRVAIPQAVLSRKYHTSYVYLPTYDEQIL